MNRKQTEILDRCIQLLETGSSLQDCFNRYAEMTPEMRRALEAASVAMKLKVDDVPTEAVARSRSKLLAKATVLADKDSHSNFSRKLSRIADSIQGLMRSHLFLNPLASRLALIIGIAALLVLLSGGLVITSAKSLPGETLYPLKRAVEDLSLDLMPDKNVRADYENNYTQERVSEVNQLLELKRSQEVSFVGAVQSMQDGVWQVSGITVIVSTQTTIENVSQTTKIQVGSVVEVEGTTNDQGWIDADEVHLHEFKLLGRVEMIGSHYWQISGNRLNKNADTIIDPGIHEGDEVVVNVLSEDNGLYAQAIHRNEPGSESPQSIPSTSSEPPDSSNNHETQEETREHENLPGLTPKPGEELQHYSTPEITHVYDEGDGGSATPAVDSTPEPTEDD